MYCTYNSRSNVNMFYGSNIYWLENGIVEINERILRPGVFSKNLNYINDN